MGAFLESPKGQALKETELLPQFLADLFVGALGYSEPPAAGYTLRREATVKVDGKFADRSEERR